jgi:hypothetical protein
MAESNADPQSLPLNFPQTFLPDRRLLARLLPFAAANGRGDKVQIGAETGIPTGQSTGKVEPMIHYARGMGLVEATRDASRWILALTPLGRVVVAEDPYLSQPVTLWLLHLLLCRRSGLVDPATGIADPWFALFAEGSLRLGSRFEPSAYLAYLTERHGTKGYLKGLAGLVLRSYLETTCFGPLRALSVESSASQSVYLRQAAPDERSHFPAYTAYLFLVWDELYGDHDQLAMSEFFTQTRCLAVLGWDRGSATQWLDWMADRGLLQLDRQTGGTLALRLRDTMPVLSGIYDELI